MNKSEQTDLPGRGSSRTGALGRSSLLRQGFRLRSGRASAVTVGGRLRLPHSGSESSGQGPERSEGGLRRSGKTQTSLARGRLGALSEGSARARGTVETTFRIWGLLPQLAALRRILSCFAAFYPPAGERHGGAPVPGKTFFDSSIG